MDAGLILETTFLIDLERELGRQASGPAQEFLSRHPTEPLHITFTIAGELAAGLPANERGRWEEFIAPFNLLSCSEEVCWEYGKAFRYLKANGLLIGTNDLWIAATAIAFAKPLVTQNEREFRRVPGLQVLNYLAS
ncbi:MAG: type II toxin-antitoxin system VapC family toxin [Gemmatimonadetes bacterium]|nr:type II toxin-antitoxin system VapC family toxin [Gemmatimonadota bacterium]